MPVSFGRCVGSGFVARRGAGLLHGLCCHRDGNHVQVLAGELLVVVGQVGAGKSSLLSAVLGEMWEQKVICCR